MHRLTVTLPDAVHAQLKQLAKAEGIPVQQYVTCAIARHIEIAEAGLPTVSELLPKSDRETKSLEELANEELANEELAN